MKKSINIIWIALVSMAFVSCNNSEGKKQVVQKVQQEIVKTEKLGAKYQVGDHVPNELVCMVNNAYMGKPQMPVPVDGKTYYLSLIHISEPTRRTPISYAVFCLKKKKKP